MARYKENDCVGCSPCMGCGRRFGYTIYVCDQCGAETNDEDEIHEVNGFDICDKCYQQMIEEEEKEEQEARCKECPLYGIEVAGDCAEYCERMELWKSHFSAQVRQDAVLEVASALGGQQL